MKSLKKKNPQINLHTQLLQPTCVLAFLFLLQTKNIEGHYSNELQADFSNKFTVPYEDNLLP